MERLGTHGGDSIAMGYLVLSGHVSSDGNHLTDLTVPQFQGYHANWVENFRREKLPSLVESTLIRRLLLDREPVDFIHTVFTRDFVYGGEFDMLLGARRNAWVNGIPLPSVDARQPNRALIALYPVAGASDRPALPRGAAQEERVFDFLRGGFDLLNHQLENIADQVMADRRSVLADLGPGIVNHEINQQLQVLRDATNIINLKARSLHRRFGTNDDIVDLAEGLKLAYAGTDRISGIAAAFNNLEKRQANAVVTIGQLVGEVCTLLHYRLVQLGIAVEYGPELQDIVVVTDAALVEHVILNLISNAIDAFKEDESNGDAHPHRRIAIQISEDELAARIMIANNGPPIVLPQPDRIFEKGVTTKRHGIGHGIGLYICRLVMTFLGGSIRLAPDGDIAQGMSVAFHVRLPRRSERSDEMMAATRMRIEGLPSKRA
jgi:signal transduction histidine kinase